MKTKYLLALTVVATLFSGCGTTDATSSDAENDSENTYLHNQGKSCASCHSIGGSNEEQFASGATIFTAIDAADLDTSKVSTTHTLRLVLENNASIVNYYANSEGGSGNVQFYNGSAINKFTAQVLDSNGNVVNTSATDSHDNTRLDCNSCHSASGANGAPGRIITSTNTTNITITPPTGTPTFTANVLPILDTNCKSCHGSSGAFSITTSATPYDGVTPFVNTTLLSKASGTNHGGGTILPSTSTEYATIRDWITAGALND